MNATNTAAVQVVHVPILLREGKHAGELFQAASTAMEQPIRLVQQNVQVTADVAFTELRSSGQSLVMQRRMMVSASKLVLQGRTLTCPGMHTGWDVLTTPNLSPLEVTRTECMMAPRVYATIVGLHIAAPELLAENSGWVKVYALAGVAGGGNHGFMNVLGQFASDPEAGKC